MKNLRFFLVGTLLSIATWNSLYAQKPVKDCKDIKLEVNSTNPEAGKSNGVIELVFKDAVENYIIYWVNAGKEGTGKDEVRNGRIQDLKSGFVDLLIIDKRKKQCTRQLTVILK